ncbi:PREDICTED: ubiquitin-like-specific protease 1D isoform X2 [Tarenaya hassleriana]|uniref:ubiquitin-like-specific protease 1D isoform X2 n=1 Tax=Tarenaya hassleriana TaxID=28532 RepID=UPI00053C0823|nr:PREDICTED: ubiquitin-like-specific protease 1D isoform X2 [Tarenaya hassleriana]
MTIRRSDRVRKKKFLTNSDPAIHEIDDEPYAKHRTCWRHIAAHMSGLKKKLPMKELDRYKLTAPCFYEMCKHSERSPRRIKCKYLVSKLRKKLDSRVFGLYLEDLWKSFSDDKKNPFMYLDCLWFSMYTTAHLRSNVLTWIQTKHIFSKKSHWYLLIFCNFDENLESQTGKKAFMLLLDSLQTAGSRQLEPDIRRFVLDIYKTEGRTQNLSLVSKIPLFVPEVPQQRNDVECGSFVLYYINRFIEDAPESLNPYFMNKDWFGHEALDDFRNKLDSLGAIV